ncbi:putative C6 transcription factor [Aspergillus sclerotioniger CBS 115572]|uniref:Putative C6 transcription factor n=1 Tax=Aspergillus sclerotioniger CBS 115572 TaxID=1450535 RepID=A0A317W1A8_9EURO|nr:putative C6 transcription factor [Aspergillus sclerotioniger CBS 115572]PWY80263.1 putative C6 transcription factor [Aspergillus sclerotioniger CBS 115572]
MPDPNSHGRQTRSPAVRRNGSLQSCEPCRKSKLRCDHGRPVCSRCSTKNIAARCFYHPAPMTKRVASGLVKPSRQSRSQPNSNISSPGPALESIHRLRTTLESPSASPGYLGSTSFSAVLAEHRLEFSLNLASSSMPGTLARPIDPERLQTGMRLLKLLHSLKVCDSLIRRYYSRVLVGVIPETVMTSILRSTRNVLESIDHGGDVDSQFQDLVCKISQNTSRPLSTHGSMTVEQYCATFTDENLRWEAIGIVFATSGISLSSTPENDPDLNQVAPDNPARDRLRAQLVEASGTCLGFCDQMSSVNELLGFYQYNDVAFLTHCYGDSSYQAWRRRGELSATIYAAGLHQEGSPADDCPFFLQQWRRWCFAAAFSMDKNQATFVGRPPSINYRYCTLTPPLDLSEDLLITGGDNLASAISKLDSSGWAAKDENDRVSVLRLRFTFAVFREQALEIALGTSEHVELVQRASQIIENARESWGACPARLRYDVPGQGDELGCSPKSFTLLHIFLDYLYTIFLLQRTIVKRTDTGQEALLDTSRHILSIIVKGHASRDTVLDLSTHRAWILLYYGLPSASVLILELLHQNQGLRSYTTVLPRAEIIRNLSVFISCLSWVARPGHGNYHTCKEVERKLSHILDQVLDPQPIEDFAFNDATSGLYSLLDWDNLNNWDFTSEYLPSQNGLPL